MDFSRMSLPEIRNFLEKEWAHLDPAGKEAVARDLRAGVKKLYQRFRRREALESQEKQRTDRMLLYEKEARLKGCGLIAGVDEAGRGPLAGPVVAAAVILPLEVKTAGINDSKKISPAKREQLFDLITAEAVGWSWGMATVEEIDSLNILRASLLAMQRAVLTLVPKPEFVLVDAVTIPGIDVPQLPIIKGDGLSLSIAAASIVAKVTRDRMMNEWDRQFPMYGFGRHKGYGTADHIEAIRTYGTCSLHRKTFTYAMKDETVSPGLW